MNNVQIMTATRNTVSRHVNNQAIGPTCDWLTNPKVEGFA